jgi:phosphatidylglycerophosphate synthase
VNTSALFDLIFLTRRRERFPFVKNTDAWVTVLLVDPLAIPLTILLSRTPLRGRVLPDHLSMFSLLTFFTGLAFLVAGLHVGLAMACFVISIVMDCTDGKLARNLNLRTSHGAVADAAVDLLVHGPGFVVISVWAYSRHQSLAALAVSLLMALYFSYTHLTSILRDTGVMPPAPIHTEEPDEPSAWQRFVGKRGLDFQPFGPVEVCFLVFPILFVSFPESSSLPIATAALLLVQKVASKLGRAPR